MLFKKQKCPHCGREIEATNRTCPYCDNKITSIDRKLVGPGVNSMPFWKQLLFFGTGTLIMSIIELILMSIATLFGMDEQSVYSFTIFATYFVVFALIVYFIIQNREYLLLHFKKWLPYVVGIGAGILVIGFQHLYSFILNACEVTYSVNDNEIIVENVIVSSPVLSFIIIGVMGPILEECTYRLGLFSFMTRVNRALAYVVTILLFSLAHMSIDGLIQGDINAFVNELINLPAYIISAAILTVAYDFFGITCSSVAHITNNLFVIVSVLLRAH